MVIFPFYNKVLSGMFCGLYSLLSLIVTTLDLRVVILPLETAKCHSEPKVVEK